MGRGQRRAVSRGGQRGQGSHEAGVKGHLEGMELQGYIRLGEALRREDVRQQTQYASRHLTGVAGAEFLGEGLRFDLSGFERGGDYHAILLHEDDAAEFARRLREHYAALGLSV